MEEQELANFARMVALDVAAPLLKELADMPCPEASGFEGPDTYPDCGKCVVCLAKRGQLPEAIRIKYGIK